MSCKICVKIIISPDRVLSELLASIRNIFQQGYLSFVILKILLIFSTRKLIYRTYTFIYDALSCSLPNAFVAQKKK